MIDLWNRSEDTDNGLKLHGRTNNGVEAYNRVVNQELGKNSSGGIGLLAFAKRLHDHIEGRATRYSNILHGHEDPPNYLPAKYPEIPPEYEDFDPSPASFCVDGRPLEVEPVV